MLNKYFDMWHVTGDTWQVTRDTWHVTSDTWHVTHSVGWTFSQNFSSLAIPVWDWQCLEDISTNHQSLNYLITFINYGGDCRTAPATPGLLNIMIGTDSGVVPTTSGFNGKKLQAMLLFHMALTGCGILW